MTDQSTIFRDVVSYSIGGGWGKESPEPGTAPVAVIRGTDIPKATYGHIADIPRRHEQSRKIENRRLKAGDLILEIAGGSPTSGQSTGRSLLVTEKLLNSIGLDVIPASFCKLVRLNSEKVVPLYAYYALQDMYKSGRAHNYEHQSTGISNFQFEFFLDTERLRLPALKDQQEIAEILGALDDKIELNRRMNRTLEAIAQAVFHNKVVQAKTNKSIEQPLDDIAFFLNGLALQKFPPQGSDFLPVIKIAQLRVNNTSGADRASKDLPSKYIIEDGDILFSWSGSLEVIIWGGGLGALNQHLFKVTSEMYPKWFYYLWIKHHLPAFQEIASGKATTMGHIQRHHLNEAMVWMPDKGEMRALDEIMSPLIAKIVSNMKENRTLEELRDALLPKLMSGEVRVKVD